MADEDQLRCDPPATPAKHGVITDPEISARILVHLGLRAAVPPVAPVRGSPHDDDLELAFPDF